MFFNKEWERVHGLETDYMKLYYYEFTPGFSDTYNSYSYFRLCTILEGDKKVRVDDGKDFIYSKNQYVMLSPNSKVHMTMPKKTKALVLELSDKLIDDVSRKIAIEGDREINLDTSEFQLNNITRDMLESLDSINSIYSTSGNDKDKVFFMDLAVQKMTYGLLKDNHSRSFLFRNNNDPMSHAMEIMKSELKSGISVSEVAFRLNMSLSSFSNKFKQSFNITPKQYLDTLKMEQAKEELRNKNVSEVAFEMGYSNVSSFIHKFKEYYNITPKQYQMKA